MYRLTMMLGVVAAGLVMVGPSAAQVDARSATTPHRCLATVEAEIGRVGLVEARIEAIQIAQQIRQIGDNMRTVGFDGWVRLNDCAGSMVVDMDTRCGVRQTYVRGMCGVDGVKTFD